jgi:hypothetical protein
MAPQPENVSEVTWTAEFSSRKTCQEAGKEIADHFNYKDPASPKARLSQFVNWICVEK